MNVCSITPLPFNEDEYEPTMLVRAFSMSVKVECEHQSDGGSDIEKALVQDFEIKERKRKEHIRKINAYLEATRPSELMELQRQRQALQAAMDEFGSMVKNSSSEDVYPSLTSWEDVKRVVEKRMECLERKKEKSKFRSYTGKLRSFCCTIQRHSTTLKMLPAGNEYASVFYGALTTVILAAENYTKVMDFLPAALIEINDAVSAIKKRLWLYSGDDGDIMSVFAWRMYGQIFSFLTHLIRWYTKRSIYRLRDCFDESLQDFYKEQVKEIRKTADLIREEAHFREQADVRKTLMNTESIDERTEILTEKVDELARLLRDLQEADSRRYNESEQARERRYEDFCARIDETRRNSLRDRPAVQARLEDVYIRVRREDAAKPLVQILEGEARRQIDEFSILRSIEAVPEKDRHRPISPKLEQDALRIESHPEAKKQTTSRDVLLVRTAKLEDAFDRDKIQENLESSSSFYTDPDIVARMQEWAISPQSGVLHIAGTEHSNVESVAAQYSAVARDAGLPVCSYFCDLQHEEPPPGRTREAIEFVALVYSLIRQLVELLPFSDTEMSLDVADIDALEGTLDTFPQAMAILDSLLSSTGRSIIIIVIDSLHVLDDTSLASTDAWLKTFIELLLKHVNKKEDEDERILKVLFTTNGRSLALLDMLEPEEILFTSMSDSPRRNRRGPSVEPMFF